MSVCVCAAQVTAAHSLAVSAGLVACACASGVVRLFSAGSLAFRGNLPRPSSRTAPRNGAGDAAPGPLSATQDLDCSALRAKSCVDM